MMLSSGAEISSSLWLRARRKRAGTGVSSVVTGAMSRRRRRGGQRHWEPRVAGRQVVLDLASLRIYKVRTRLRPCRMRRDGAPEPVQPFQRDSEKVDFISSRKRDGISRPLRTVPMGMARWCGQNDRSNLSWRVTCFLSN